MHEHLDYGALAEAVIERIEQRQSGTAPSEPDELDAVTDAVLPRLHLLLPPAEQRSPFGVVQTTALVLLTAAVVAVVGSLLLALRGS